MEAARTPCGSLWGPSVCLRGPLSFPEMTASLFPCLGCPLWAVGRPARPGVCGLWGKGRSQAEVLSLWRSLPSAGRLAGCPPETHPSLPPQQPKKAEGALRRGGGLPVAVTRV